MISKEKILNVVPYKLKEARLSRGYTSTALAELFGLQKQTISKYELGQCNPSSDVVEKYCRILNFPIEYFLNDENEIKGKSAVFFRSLKSADSQIREEIKTRLIWTNRIYQHTNNFIEYPPLNLPDLGELLNDELDIYKIEEIATSLRDYWKLGDEPIKNLAMTLELNGIVLCVSNIAETNVDACSQTINDTAIFFIRRNDISACRLRFDLAHELGHLILHSAITKEEMQCKEVLDRVEKEANMFASAFLLPRDKFGKEVLSISLDHFINLKSRWKVSISAMIYRCSELGIFNEAQVLYLRKAISAKKWRKIEPLDDIIIREKPNLIANAIKIIIEQGLETKHLLKSLFKLSSDDITQLFDLPNDYLKDAEEIKLNIKSNILPFPLNS